MKLKINTDKPSLCKRMDPEVIELCHALNSIPGIETLDSCSGHGKESVHIFFRCNDHKGLFFVARCIDRRYSKHPWLLEILCGDTAEEGYTATSFMLRSIHPWLRNGHENIAVGQEAYDQAAYLIQNINYHLNHTRFVKKYQIDVSLFDTVEIPR